MGSPPETDPDRSEEPDRTSFPKAPLFVLGLVFGVLLIALAVRVLFSDADDEIMTPIADGKSGEEQGSLDSGSTEQPDVGAGAGAGKGTASEDDVASTTSAIDRLDDPEYVIRTLAAGFSEDLAGVVDEAEAECMAREVVQLFGVHRLWQLTEAMTDASANSRSFDPHDPRLMNEDEVRRLHDRIRPCVSEDAARRLDL